MNQTLQHSDIRSTLQCPTCSTTRLYRLADGRFKCSLCRRVFSFTDNRHSRLAAETRDSLAKAFWNMSGTSETAEMFHLNIKTVQKYFGLLREKLAKQSQKELIQQFGYDTIPNGYFDQFPSRTACGRNAQPLAAVVKTGSELKLLIADPVVEHPVLPEGSILGWIYAQDSESIQRLSLDRIHCQSRDSDSTPLAMPFWQFIKQGLIHYQGGFRHHFNQYLREMEFRYNDRKIERGPDICLHYLAAE